MADPSKEPATADQKAFLSELGINFQEDISRQRATELISSGVDNRDAKKAAAERDRKSAVKARKKQAKKGGGLKSLVRLVLFLAVLGLLAAIFIPSKATGDGSELDQDRIRSARSKLLALKDQPQSSQRFSEAEINAYLHDVVANRNVANAAGTQLRPEVINVNVGENALDLTVQSKFGNLLPISYQLSLQPSPDGIAFDPQPTAAKLGILPMPGPLQKNIFHKMEAMFRGMPTESGLWKQLELFEAKDGAVTVRRAR